MRVEGPRGPTSGWEKRWGIDLVGNGLVWFGCRLLVDEKDDKKATKLGRRKGSNDEMRAGPCG